MTISQAIEYISRYFDNNLTKIVACLKHDCNINQDIIKKLLEKIQTIETYDLYDRLVEEYISFYQINDGNIFLLNILDEITLDEKNTICEFAEHLVSYNDTSTPNTPQAVVDTSNFQPTFTINNNNSATANASNENMINISTLSQLSTQVSQSTTIENKQEIQNLIAQLEDAKDNDEKESYFTLFFKLLDKLQGSGLVPDWLVKSAKFAKKFIE